MSPWVPDGLEANQTAHFPDSLRTFPFGGIFDIGRWMSRRNEPGPLSETVSATVTV
ncbi:MAG: hypothetical protein HND43_07530 [Armatimonadetes bacterium]|nr:hypothetical protein [Armatimonadota bacterium]